MSFSSYGTGMQNRKSRDTWNNRQVWLGVQNEAGQRPNRVLSRKHTGHSKDPFPTTQETTLHMNITRWSIQKLIIFFAAKHGEALDSQQEEDWELTVAQIMNSLLLNSDLN